MKSVFFFFCFLGLTAIQAKEIDVAAFQKAVEGAGARGWIHGAAHELGEYVFTYREPGDFFSHLECSLIPATRKLARVFATLDRHDEVQIQGKVKSNKSKQIHIAVTELKVLKKYSAGVPVPAFHRTVGISEELQKQTSLLATVHAVAGDGGILVLEYKDTVVPVFVEDPSLARDLYRGDKVRVHYTIQKSPKGPTHLNLSTEISPAIEVLDKIVEQNEKELVLEGSLVFFPKSPQIRFGIYAVQVVDKDGLKRNYTLVNFEDPEVFQSILKKLEGVWNPKAATVVNGRNCLINPAIRLRAKGMGNVVSASQANPQILLEGPDSVEIVP